jgi:predicted acylesterase/phospholipase RssA
MSNQVDDPYKQLIDDEVRALANNLSPEFDKFRALQRAGIEKLGGVCAGGGGKGWYDVGVTEFLYDIGFMALFNEKVDNGMPAGELFGTSFGALWAAAVARAGGNKFKFQEAFFYIKSNESVYKGKIDLPNIVWTGATNGQSLLDNAPLKNRLIELFGEKGKFSDQPIPARVTAFCIADDNPTKLTHDIVTFKGDDLVVPCSLASASIPGAFRPTLYKGMLLIDGGVAANDPILYACENGCTRIMGPLYCSPDTSNNPTSKMKGIRETLVDLPQGAMDAFEKYIHKAALNFLKLQQALGQRPASILTNEPDFDTLSPLEFTANRWLRERGYRDAKKKFTREVILNLLFGPGGMVSL